MLRSGSAPEKRRPRSAAAVPAILAGLMGVAQKPEGRDRLAALVQGQDTSVLDNVAGALSGGREQSLIDSGRGVLSSLFGAGKFDGLASAIGRSSGLNQSSAGSLLGALAPVVLGALGREQRAQGLDAQGLARMLSDQKDDIAHALPSGLASALGPTGLLDGVADRLGEGVSTAARTGRTTAAATRPITTAPPPRRTSMLPWILGLAALLALLWAAYHFLFRDEPVREATQVGQPAANLMVGDVNVGQQVTDVFNNATTALNGVTDAASAEAARTEAERNQRQPDQARWSGRPAAGRRQDGARRLGVRATAQPGSPDREGDRASRRGRRHQAGHRHDAAEAAGADGLARGESTT